MTVDEEREVVMGELWVSHDELVDAIGDDGADLLCRAVGGVSTYIPRTQPEGSPLCGFPAFRRPRDGAHGKALCGLRRAPGDASEQA